MAIENSPEPSRDITLYDQAKLKRDRARVRRGFWPKLKRTLGRLPFADDLVAAYYCAIDRATPAYVRAVLMGALAYFILPADVIPDFIVGLGYSDDASVLLAAVAAVRVHIKPEHRAKAQTWLAAAGAEPSDKI